jgi:hypothetical protein
MGQLRFLVPQANRVSAQAVQTAHISGRDRLPFVCRVTVGSNGELTIERDEDESGTFNMLWPVAERGNLLLSTATLVERAKPYLLPLELARGTLNRLRNLWAEWQSVGAAEPAGVQSQLTESRNYFVEAVAKQQSLLVAAELADKAIAAALLAMDGVAAAMAEQVRKARQLQTQRVLPLFAGRMSGAMPEGAVSTAFLAAFNSVAVPFSWGRVEADEGKQDWAVTDAQVRWAHAHNLRVCGGPLLELRRRTLPDWIYLWEGDFDNLLMVAGDYIRAVVTRYRGKVHFWNAAGRLFTGEALGLDEEQKLRLAVRTVEVIRSVDPQSPIIVSVDQPWGEAMSRRETEISPLQLADTFVRSDLGVSGIGVEINLGLTAQATLPRDLLEFGLQLDIWSSLGLPLLVSITAPTDGDGFTSGWQQTWLEKYLPVVLARSSVQAVIWNQLYDGDADDFPHSGLVDGQRQVKPAFGALAALRQQYSA